MTLPIGTYDQDEDLITATADDGVPRLRVYPFAGSAVVLGRGSKPDVELETATCVSDGVPILRRRGGGCAVVLDSGNVIVSLVLPVPGIGANRRHFDRISGWLIAGLGQVGLGGLRQDGISDLVRGDRKVGGACIYRRPGLLFYSASLLSDADTRLLGRYLRHPPREPDYRRGRDHAAFVTTLGMEPKALANALEDVLDPSALTHTRAT